MKRIKANLPELMKQGGVVVDVRSRGEFAQGARPGSMNLPLDEIERHLQKLDKSKPVILCCASGARSGMAVSILKSAGFQTVVNAGPWTNTMGI